MNADRQSANRTELNPVSVEFHRLPCVSPVLVAPFLFSVFLIVEPRHRRGFTKVGRREAEPYIFGEKGA